MSTKRLNITIPEEMIYEIRAFSIRNLSRFITEAIRERLEGIKKARLQKFLAEGYKATREEDKEIDKEWEKITMEKW